MSATTLPPGNKLQTCLNKDLMHCSQLCLIALQPVQGVGVHMCSCTSHVAGSHNMPRPPASTCGPRIALAVTHPGLVSLPPFSLPQLSGLDSVMG